MNSLLIKEKLDAKLLYFFDTDLFNSIKILNESESSEEGYVKKTIKYILGIIKSILLSKYTFIMLLILLIIFSLIQVDVLALLGGAIAGLFFDSVIKSKTEKFGAMLSIEKKEEKINDFLEKNGYSQIKYDDDGIYDSLGICYFNNDLLTVREALDKSFENNYGKKNKFLNKISKNKSKEEVLEELYNLADKAENDIIKFLKENNYINVNFEERAIINLKNKKLFIFSDVLEEIKKTKKTEEEKNEIDSYKDTYKLILDFGDKVGKRGWFGLKSIIKYFDEKAKSVQDKLSDLLSLIASIFNESINLTKFQKKELKKINLFLEKYLKDKKENKKEFYNENFNLPFSKNGNAGNVIKITYKINDHNFIINSITKTVGVYGNNPQEVWKKIFPDKNIVDNEYQWKKGEWGIIKKYIENQSAGFTKDKKENDIENKTLDNKQNNKISDTENEKSENIENVEDDKSNINDVEDAENNNKNDDNADDENVDQIENNKDSENVNDVEKNDTEAPKPSRGFLFFMQKAAKTKIAKYLIIGLMICTALIGTFMGGTNLAIATEISKATGTASLGAINLSPDVILKWLGWGNMGGGITYSLLRKKISGLSSKEISNSIKNANENASNVNKILDPLKAMEVVSDKEENKVSIKDKIKNKIKSVFKSDYEINYIKNDVLYNEEYIMKSYFSLENKLKKSKNYF